MQDYKTLEKRYMSDPLFHRAIKVIYQIIDDTSLTPGEMRDAVMLACMHHEMLNPGRTYIADELSLEIRRGREK